MKRKWYDRLEEIFCGCALIAMLVVLTMQIVSRYAFGHALNWTEELARYFFIMFVYFAASLAVLENAHLKIDGLLGAFPKSTRKYVVLLGRIIFFLYCIVMGYYTFLKVKSTYSLNQVMPSLPGVKMWIFYGAAPLCHALMAIRLIQTTIRWFKTSPEWNKNLPAETEESEEKKEGQ